MSLDVVLVARALLAGVFATAAAGKLIDLAGSRAAMEQFGLPRRARALRRRGAAAARGRASPSLCSSTRARGSLRSAPWPCLPCSCSASAACSPAASRPSATASARSIPPRWAPATLGRNAGLAVLAAVAALSHRQGSISGWIAGLRGMGVLAACRGRGARSQCSSAALLFARSLLKRHGAVLLQPRRGRSAARFGRRRCRAGTARARPAALHLSGLHGDTATLESLLAPGHPLLLLFTDPGCGPCTALMPEVAQWQSAHAGFCRSP